ncbi:MAG: hypothetical protein IT424_01020 [Pirellulales bacterium]|nr:hypothetical protein [Pirellulales bacterium]
MLGLLTPLKLRLATGWLTVLVGASACAQTGYFGTATISINPTTPVMLSGYAFRSSLPESTAIQQNIVAQAAAFGMGAETALLVTVDCTGVPDNVIDPLALALSADYGIAPERIVVSSTHSHSCPHVAGYLSNLFDPPLSAVEQQHVNRYTQELTAHLEEVAGQALANRTPGHQFAWGSGSVGFAENRRGTIEAPVDHDLPVMLVRDSIGAPQAIIASYASHAVTLNAADNVVSGDWPGYAREAIEAMYPGATAMIMIGAAGDSNPSPAGTPAVAQSHGQSIADEVRRLIDGRLLAPVSQDLAAFHSEIELDYATRLEPGDPSSARLAPGPASAMYGVTSWTFGKDLAMVFMEGEVVVDYSLRLKQELGDKLWLNAYSNDVQGYIPSERILFEGGYEADSSTYYYAVPGRFAHGLEDKIVAAVHDHLDDFTGIADRLRLVVDSSSGGLSIANLGDEVVTIDGYTIAAPSGSLIPAAGRWNSLQAQGLPGWDRADNSSSFRLTEFNPSGSLTLLQGQSVSLGTPLAAPPPAKFGDPLPEVQLTFEYSVPGQGAATGVVGAAPGDAPHNNLVLTIDPATGEAAIENESPFFDVAISAYTIASASGKLLPSGGDWRSLQDQTLAGWDEADNASTFRLTEFKTSGATQLVGGQTVLDLGSPVDVSAGVPQLSDLKFEFLLSTGEIIEGVIELGAVPGGASAGDYNGNGKVDGADFLVWQRAFGANVAPGSGADGDGDGVVTAADRMFWYNRFGAGASSVAAPVPEPTAVLLCWTALVAVGARRMQGFY